MLLEWPICSLRKLCVCLECQSPSPLIRIPSSLVTSGGLCGSALTLPWITAALVILRLMARHKWLIALWEIWSGVSQARSPSSGILHCPKQSLHTIAQSVEALVSLHLPSSTMCPQNTLWTWCLCLSFQEWVKQQRIWLNVFKPCKRRWGRNLKLQTPSTRKLLIRKDVRRSLMLGI